MELEQLTTCEISDALIQLRVPQGGYIPDIYPYSPFQLGNVKLCGPAYTVQMVHADNDSAPRLSNHFVDTAPAGSVIFIDAPLETPNAVWGGLMTAGALARGVKGVVISGRCRDVEEHRVRGFPVFARGLSTLGQSMFTRPSAVNASLSIEPVTIKPGDWIVADENGVVCVPRDLVVQVVTLGKKIREIDELCVKDIDSGKGVQATFKLHRGK